MSGIIGHLLYALLFRVKENRSCSGIWSWPKPLITHFTLYLPWLSFHISCAFDSSVEVVCMLHLNKPHQGTQHNISCERSSKVSNKTVRARRNTISAVTTMSHLMCPPDDFCSSVWVHESPRDDSSADTLRFTFTVKWPRETFLFLFFFCLSGTKNKSITLGRAVTGSVSQLPVTAAVSFTVTRWRAANLIGVIKHEKARLIGKRWHNKPNNSSLITVYVLLDAEAGCALIRWGGVL